MTKNAEQRTCLFGGPVFDGERLWQPGRLVLAGQRVEEVSAAATAPSAMPALDVAGRLIMPGLVDLHSDALEKCIEMRPGVFFDPLFALQNLDHRLASCGVTTFCHAVSFADTELGLRSAAEAERITRLLRLFGAAPETLVDHRIHGRFEVGSRDAAKVLLRLVKDGTIDLVSVMDHTPGQGQFRSLEAYVRFYSASYAMSAEQVLELARKKENGRDAAWREVVELTTLVNRLHLPLLSHDDDSAEKVRLVAGLGARGAEFPVTLTAAHAARERGMGVFMGAPNLLRGESSSGHLKAEQALDAGCCLGLLSDYYPESLLQAPFVAHRRLGMDLCEALALVTSNPGAFLEPDSRLGFLRPGSPADCLVIEPGTPWVRVLQTWKKGRPVYRRAGFDGLLRTMSRTAKGHRLVTRSSSNRDSHL